MKKILLGTSAIVGASVLLAAPVWAAEKPTLKMDGWLRFEAWSVDEDAESAQRDIGFEVDDIEIHFSGSSKADNGLEYGFYVELIEDNGANAQFDEGNVWLGGGWGRLDLGSQDAVYNNYKMGAYALSADKDGAWDGNVLFTRTNNDAYIGTDFFGGDDANKITYTSPNFGGLTIGASYAPSTEDEFNSGLANDTASANGFLNGGNGNMHDQWGVAAQYKTSFDGVGIEGTARYAAAKYVESATTTKRDDAEAYGIGAKITFAGFSVAGSFNDHGDSGLTNAAKANGGDAGQWWDIGAAYATGPYKVSVIYMQSEGNGGQAAGQKDDEVGYLSIGAGYAVAPGLDLYASYQYVDLDNGNESDSEVNMFMVGTQVSF